MKLRTAVRMEVDPGWHLYWINPGEAGLPVSVEWSLPEGWSCGPLMHPMPVRFTTTGLHGFGHVGEVWFPVTVNVPRGFTGEAVLGGELKWLACNDASCVPGQQSIRLALSSDRAGQASHADAVRDAYQSLPIESPEEVKLTVSEEDGRLGLELVTNPEVSLVDGEAFVVTREVCDPSVPVRFGRKSDGVWQASVPVNEYAQVPVEALELWVRVEGSRRPWVVRWSSGAKTGEETE